MPNRLADESSPHLQAHAASPVDWYPWGSEAVEAALSQGRPILLNVGFGACHYCNSMLRECFMDPEVASVMNAHFICVKVDREERPDVDDFYTAAGMALNGTAGWPLTAFLTPELAPLFCGVNTDRDEFLELIRNVAELWRTEPDAAQRQAAEVVEQLALKNQPAPPRDLSGATRDRAVHQLRQVFDQQHGGFGAAPKFPPYASMRLLARAPGSEAREMLGRTLKGMLDGGIWDQLNGGLFRYSDDVAWRNPHFEKMLLDNVQLGRVLLEAAQLKETSVGLKELNECLEFFLTMQLPSGAFVSALAATPDGGLAYYSWSKNEIREALPEREASIFCHRFGISGEDGGEKRCVPYRAVTVPEVANAFSMGLAEAEACIEVALDSLRKSRQGSQPTPTGSIVVATNALAIALLSESFRFTGDQRLLDAAESAAKFIKTQRWDAHGFLAHGASDSVLSAPRLLADYAFLADGLVDLHEASGDAAWLAWADKLATVIVDEFYENDTGRFALALHGEPQLPLQLRESQDGVVPSPTATAARAVIRLARHHGRPDWVEKAAEAIRAHGGRIDRLPRAYADLLSAAELLLTPYVELRVESRKESDSLAAAGRALLPNRVIRHVSVGAVGAAECAPVRARCSSADQEAASWIVASESALRELSVQCEHQRSEGVTRPMIEGRATPEGTRRFFRKLKLPQGAAMALGATDLMVSRIGFGSYRFHDEIEAHHQALNLALLEGCNLIDTAPGYTAGSSERGIGNVIRDQIRRGTVARDELVIISKVGMFEHTSFEEGSGAVQLNERLWYSLQPEHLDLQLEGSLRRLGVNALDGLLIHNPELLLATCSRSEALELIQLAMVWLQTQVDSGRLGFFGVSSNELGTDSGLTLSELRQVASRASAPAFSVVELPLNLLEFSAALLRKEEEEERSVLDEAMGAGLGVLCNRPLNALRGDELLRFAEFDEDSDASDLGEARREVAKLEHQFRAELGAVLAATPDVKLSAAEFFTWAERIGEYETSSRELWNEFERDILASQLPYLVGAMNKAFSGKQLGAVWERWRDRYLLRFEELVRAARATAARRSNERNAPLLRSLRAASKEDGRDGTLSRLMLWNLASLEGVSSVLVGMRASHYVQDALGVLRWPEPSSSLESLSAAREAIELSAHGGEEGTADSKEK